MRNFGVGQLRVTHPCATPHRNGAFDLHVLSTPPAFTLSQDQTLHKMVSETNLRSCADRFVHPLEWCWMSSGHPVWSVKTLVEQVAKTCSSALWRPFCPNWPAAHPCRGVLLSHILGCHAPRQSQEPLGLAAGSPSERLRKDTGLGGRCQAP